MSEPKELSIWENNKTKTTYKVWLIASDKQEKFVIYQSDNIPLLSQPFNIRHTEQVEKYGRLQNNHIDWVGTIPPLGVMVAWARPLTLWDDKFTEIND